MSIVPGRRPSRCHDGALRLTRGLSSAIRLSGTTARGRISGRDSFVARADNPRGHSERGPRTSIPPVVPRASTPGWLASVRARRGVAGAERNSEPLDVDCGRLALRWAVIGTWVRPRRGGAGAVGEVLTDIQAARDRHCRERAGGARARPMASPQGPIRAAGPYPRPTTETHRDGRYGVGGPRAKRIFSRRCSPRILQRAYFLLAKRPDRPAAVLSRRCCGASRAKPAGQSLLELRPRGAAWGVAAPRGFEEPTPPYNTRRSRTRQVARQTADKRSAARRSGEQIYGPGRGEAGTATRA